MGASQQYASGRLRVFALGTFIKSPWVVSPSEGKSPRMREQQLTIVQNR